LTAPARGATRKAGRDFVQGRQIIAQAKAETVFKYQPFADEQNMRGKVDEARGGGIAAFQHVEIGGELGKCAEMTGLGALGPIADRPLWMNDGKKQTFVILGDRLRPRST
jgi:hypothetical protein